MRVARPGAPRRCQRELARDAPGFLDRGPGISIVAVTRWIMHTEQIERGLIHQDLADLRNDTRDRANGIAHGCVLGNREARAESPRHFRIVPARRRSDGYQRRDEAEAGLHEPRKHATSNDVLDEPAERSPATMVRFDPRILCERALEHNTGSLAHDVLVGTLSEPLRSVRLRPRAHIALLGSEHRRAEARGLDTPVVLAAEYVQ